MYPRVFVANHVPPSCYPQRRSFYTRLYVLIVAVDSGLYKDSGVYFVNVKILVVSVFHYTY